jgi:hypothetical protein
MASMIPTTTSFALAAATLAMAVPAGARTVNSWDVVPNQQTCTMISTFEDDVSIGLIWSPKTGELGFMATLPRPSGVGERPAAALALTFDGDAPLTEWEDQHAAVVAGADSDAVIANWGAEHSAELAKTVGSAGHVVVRVGGRTVGRYDLSGSSAAYRELTHCGSQIASR